MDDPFPIRPNVALALVDEWLNDSASFHISGLQLLAEIASLSVLPADTCDKVAAYCRYLQTFAESTPTLKTSLKCLKQAYYQ